jgi:murein DD-endopeptidase MepM/ murein hydrolase activator NlpD
MTDRANWIALAVISLIVAGCATTPTQAPLPEPAPVPHASLVQIPAQVTQGGLVFGTVPPGSVVVPAKADGSDAAPLRISAKGRFVVGVGRDATGSLRLRVTLAGESPREFTVEIQPRSFPQEIVDGVPQDTVTPPPEIAARIAREQARVAAVRERDDDRNDFDVHFHWPVTGRISGEFGNTRVYNGTPGPPHSGMDVAAPEGTPVHAPAAGIVTFADPDLYLTGGTLVIDHGHGLSSTFLHLSRIDVKVGERVEQDQAIALVGKTGRATGPHLHWGMNWFDVRVDPHLLVDPAGNPQSP